MRYKETANISHLGDNDSFKEITNASKKLFYYWLSDDVQVVQMSCRVCVCMVSGDHLCGGCPLCFLFVSVL